MAWNNPRTWANGEIPTQTHMNADVRDNMREVWHEVAYTQFTSTVTNSTGTYSDVVSAGAVTYTGNPIYIEFYTPKLLIAATGGASVFQDGAFLSFIGYDGVVCTGGFKRYTPTAASHTFKIMIVGTGGGSTSSAYADAASPGFIRILEKGGP